MSFLKNKEECIISDVSYGYYGGVPNNYSARGGSSQVSGGSQVTISHVVDGEVRASMTGSELHDDLFGGNTSGNSSSGSSGSNSSGSHGDHGFGDGSEHN